MAVGLVFLVVVVTQIVEETVGLIIFRSAVGKTQIVEWTVGHFIINWGTQIVEKTVGLFTFLGSGVGAS